MHEACGRAKGFVTGCDTYPTKGFHHTHGMAQH